MSEPLEVCCPCCDARLSVDPETGAVLFHAQPKISEKISLEDAVKQEEARRGEAGARLQQAFDERHRQEGLLEKKFREAQKRAELDPDKPRSPFDLD
ncbi:MAG: hypothetical protein V3U86_08730 [Acidobacteriota bacterium]|nr:hypothetical protein [Acidobacteriota bacterium]